MRFFLDTNVILSSLLWNGNEYMLVRRLREGNHAAMVCRTVLLESLEKLIEKFGMEAQKARELVGSATDWMERHPDAGRASDPDQIIVDTAHSVRADFLVTGDRRLLHRRQASDVVIVRASDALRILGG
jgi:putative PIN family toxin of toxin-antitoxin system